MQPANEETYHAMQNCFAKYSSAGINSQSNLQTKSAISLRKLYTSEEKYISNNSNE